MSEKNQSRTSKQLEAEVLPEIEALIAWLGCAAKDAGPLDHAWALSLETYVDLKRIVHDPGLDSTLLLGSLMSYTRHLLAITILLNEKCKRLERDIAGLGLA